jgi:hypothetical protein|eukprot:CAMPEP_0174298436 /NCGR_PEP_ID=MMETSP0809-20121228/53770_1 /TAXON_ID=73025 ORGANISM="Eutreptiella gymnastica-like, Strain CCMP1594" /NCGR_SAMPLE_ID=MMETSP0809 /ASSEMBLY_ACC=CAM_ASM_000658 /LENGTH=152 /DNA_ID=CAMNT_0015402885 /DNA_START=546 /DNA_END=1004 /DNA_ORIENTATION=+
MTPVVVLDAAAVPSLGRRAEWRAAELWWWGAHRNLEAGGKRGHVEVRRGQTPGCYVLTAHLVNTLCDHVDLYERWPRCSCLSEASNETWPTPKKGTCSRQHDSTVVHEVETRLRGVASSSPHDSRRYTAKTMGPKYTSSKHGTSKILGEELP